MFASMMKIMAVALAGVAGTVLATELHVSTRGDDVAVGARTLPLRSAQGALDRVRSLRSAGELPKGEVVRICFGDGRYILDRPLSLGKDDSDVEFVAEHPGRVVFDAGRRLPRFVADGRLWKVAVPEGFRFEQLYVNGRRAVRARSPNDFYYYLTAPVQKLLLPHTGRVEAGGRCAAYAYKADVAPLAGLSRRELSRVVIHHFHSWSDSYARILKLEPDTGLLVETPNSKWGLLETFPESEPRYVLENYFAALDCPGEWFLDEDSWTLYYFPREGETTETARAIAPLVEKFVEARNSRNVLFSGIAFEHSAYVMPPQGEFSRQGVTDVHGAIDIAGSENFVFDKCRFERIGSHAVHFNEGSRKCVLRRSLVRDVGGSAVFVGERVEPWGKRLGALTEDVVVEDNILQAGGRVFAGAVGAIITHSRGVRLSHNDIGDFLYSGVSCGWTWEYQKSYTSDAEISWNHVHNCGQGVLSDLGGIYTLGSQPGTRVFGNVVHDVYSYDRSGRGAWGIYGDGSSSDMLYASNVVYRTKTGCGFAHFGKNNVWCNNILAISMSDRVMNRGRAESHRTIDFRHNIVYSDNDTKLIGGGCKSPGKVDDAAFDENLYFNSSRPCGGKDFFKTDFKTWQAGGQDRHSLVADPKFADPANGDFSLAKDSPAFSVGFKEFDWKSAGVRGSDRWKAEAAKCSLGPVRWAPEPPKLALKFPRLECDFEAYGRDGIDGLFAHACMADGKNAFIRATDKVVHSGKYALELHDAPGMRFGYEPHIFRRVSRLEGKSQISFAIKTYGKDSIGFLLRDYNPVSGKVLEDGPSIRFEGGMAKFAGEVCPLSKDGWTTVVMEIDIDRRDWSVSLAPDGEPRRGFGPFEMPKDFRRLDWIGFTTDSENDSSWYLDDFKYTIK